MKNVDWEKLREVVRNTDKAILVNVVKIDGHTIYDPKFFTEKGLDSEVVAAFTKNHRSGSSPKEMLSDDKGYVDSLRGVYGLEVLEFIAKIFDVDSWKMGRGSRAWHLTEQLVAKWAKEQ